VQRLDAVFDIEREINGLNAEARRVIRQERSVALMEGLHVWLTAQLAKLSRNHDLAKAINYMLRRWPVFTRFLDDGRVYITNNAAERTLRCVPLGRKAWLFCGSDRGGQRAAIIYTLIGTAKAQRHRSASLARRRPGSHRRASGLTSCCHGTGARSPRPQSRPDNAHQQGPFRQDAGPRR
jgi:hypothetical protein